MNALVMYFLLANQTKPCEQQGQKPVPQQTAEPPLADGPVPPPIVQPGGFVPYHLIPRPRFPLADAFIERCRCLAQNRPHLWRR